jgi:uncharacterized DUF497 family protein
MTIEFEWDASKAKTNLAKHRISFEEATSAFYDALSITIADPDHSVSESRFLLIYDDRASRDCGTHRSCWTNTNYQYKAGDPQRTSKL